MAQFETLNPENHRECRVITDYAEAFGDNVDTCMTFPTEFGDVQREYPILFRKNPETGEFTSYALLGLQAGENLFLSDDHWHASYVPASIARGPFLIGIQDQTAMGRSEQEPVINIDMANPRVNTKSGQEVFVSDDQPSDYLQSINRILKAIHQGIDSSRSMFDAFISCELIEPVTLNITLDSGRNLQLSGYYTIHEEKLAALSGEALQNLHSKGYLQAAYLVIASLNNIKKLVDMKNQRESRQ